MGTLFNIYIYKKYLLLGLIVTSWENYLAGNEIIIHLSITVEHS